MIRPALLFVVAAVLMAAAAQGARKPAAKTSDKVVDTDWLAAHLSDKNVVVLHVGADRTAYDTAHIPGARFLALRDIAITRNGIPVELPPADDLKRTFEQLGIGDHSRVVLYGDNLNLYAARAYVTLDYLGLGRIAVLLDGGLAKWAQVHEVSRVALAAAAPAVLAIHPRPELVVGLEEMKALVAARKTPIVDARPPADYTGAVSAEGIPRAGHIPGAKNVFWQETLVSKENPVFKTTSEILARYAAAGLTPGATVVVYCRVGVQASHDYFTLKLAGFRPVLYDGSLAEWSNAPGTGVETGSGGMH